MFYTLLSSYPNPKNLIHSWIKNTKSGEFLVFSVPYGNIHCNELSGASPQNQWIYVLHEPIASPKSLKTINIIDLLKSISHLVSIESIKTISQSKQHTPSPHNSGESKNKNSKLNSRNFDLLTPQSDNQAQEPSNIEVVLRKRAKPLAQIEAPSMQDLIARALRLYSAKEYESVLDILDNYSWLASQSADILNAAGASAFALKLPQRGTSLYRRATEIMPTHYDAWNNLGIALSESGAFSEAEAAHRKAIELRPQELSFHADLARLLSRTDRISEAHEICANQLAKNPTSIFMLGELGNIYIRQGEFGKAREQYARILEQNPHNEAVALNCSSKLAQAGFWHDAETIHRKAIQMNQSEIARFHLSLLLLIQGRFEEGWECYEARSVVRNKELPQYQFPVWRGESIVGKSVLISFEQGFGDEIMMSRYASELKKSGASHVGIVCRRPLVPLFKTLEGAEMLTPEEGEPLITLRDDQFDYWTLPFEIPRYLKTNLDNIPVKVPYLKSLPERRKQWVAKILQETRGGNEADETPPLRVGLAWKGSTLHGADSERSLSNLRVLAPLWEVEGVQFYSLQKGQGEEELEEMPKHHPIVDLGRSIEDFADTAAIIDEMDLIISVDTAVVHIAGAMNKPCWVMIPYYATDWRWLLERNDSPWYPSLRLLRQDHSGNWRAIVAQIQEELIAVVAQRQTELADSNN